MPSPLISVVIPYHRRGDVFDQCLDSVVKQEYVNREIIVVDDCSQDGLEKRISARHSDIKVITLPANLGACAARNAGIRAASGEILVFIDDDVSFESPSTLSAVAATLADHPAIAVLAFQVCDPRTGKVRTREWCHTRPYKDFVEQEFETNWFGEGASAVRREVFQACGSFYEPFFYGAEGHDLIVRILDHGFRILHTPHIRVNHWAPETGRMVDRQYYYFTRNYVWMAYKDYPFSAGICFLVPKLLMMLYFACRAAVYRPFVAGVWHGLTGLRLIHKDRTPISRSTIARLEEFERWRPWFITRLARHRAGPQI
jgi:GT2 family glycosyltransferase